MTPSSGRSGFSAARLVNASVIDVEEKEAAIVSVHENGPEMQACMRLNDGTQLLVPVSLLSEEEEGVYRLPFSFNAAREGSSPQQMRFPVMEEVLQIGKRTVDTGRGVRLHKTVSEREEVLDQTLRRDELEVERVPVGRVVSEDDIPQVRHEGDTTVVPVLEEVLVVQKQLLIKEELRITRHQRAVVAPRTVSLRSEKIAVERFDEGKAR
ncbi:MAG TPA: DUF2382 domain-containing protein [Noviherbaspirillum sp.]|nr:DUF2382 domain-containing protein [Noviherbaspirillum sp.]